MNNNKWEYVRQVPRRNDGKIGKSALEWIMEGETRRDNVEKIGVILLKQKENVREIWKEI